MVLSFMNLWATESLLKVHSPTPGTFWSISQGIVVLTPIITSCGTEIGSRLTTDSFKWAFTYMLGSVLSNLILTLMLWDKYYYYQHFPGEETEAWRGHVTWPRSHSQYVAKLGFLAPELIILITPNQSPYLEPWGASSSLFFIENDHDI